MEISGTPRPRPPPHLKIFIMKYLYPGGLRGNELVVTLSGKEDIQFYGHSFKCRCNLMIVIEKIVLPFCARQMFEMILRNFRGLHRVHQ